MEETLRAVIFCGIVAALCLMFLFPFSTSSGFFRIQETFASLIPFTIPHDPCIPLSFAAKLWQRIFPSGSFRPGSFLLCCDGTLHGQALCGNPVAAYSNPLVFYLNWNISALFFTFSVLLEPIISKNFVAELWQRIHILLISPSIGTFKPWFSPFLCCRSQMSRNVMRHICGNVNLFHAPLRWRDPVLPLSFQRQ